MAKNDKIIDYLLDVARKNNGQTTNAEKQRREAINFLTGKHQQKAPLRPESKVLLENYYDNRREV